MGVARKGNRRDSYCDGTVLYQYQYPVCETVLQFYKMLALAGGGGH